MDSGTPLKNGTKAGSDHLPEMVRRSADRYGMFAPDQALLVAVSGGVDSTAMLHALLTLSSEMRLRLGVAHLNHGLRGKESDADAEFVASLAGSCQLPYHPGRVNAQSFARRRKLSLEEACRLLRYRFLLETAATHGYDRVAVGHHRDDHAESVLMALLRGSGAAGLRGMAAVRADGVVRPMIDIPRDSIRRYAKSQGLAFVTDRTNADTALLRNRIRLELMPLLASDFNPNIVETLNRIGAILGPEDEWLSDLSHQMFTDAVVYSDVGKVSLSLERFNRLRLAARRRVFRMALAAVKGDLRRMGLVHVTDVLQLAQTGRDGACLHLPHGIRVRCLEGLLEIIDPGQSADPSDLKCREGETKSYRHVISSPGRLTIPETGDTIGLTRMSIEGVPDFSGKPTDIAYFDADCVTFPLTVRNRRPGDRFWPLGAGGTQKLKKFFCNQKVPRRRRASCPLLISAGRIIWVAGQRIDHRVRLTDRTTHVLKAERILA
jgi:tRNA(Ile)-lysidine synthase